MDLYPAQNIAESFRLWRLGDWTNFRRDNKATLLVFENNKWRIQWKMRCKINQYAKELWDIIEHYTITTDK